MTITVSLPNEPPRPQVEGGSWTELRDVVPITISYSIFSKYIINMATSMLACPLSTRSMKVNKIKVPAHMECMSNRKIGNTGQHYRPEQQVLWREQTTSLWRSNLSRDCVLYVLGSCRKLGKSVLGRRHSLGITQGRNEFDEFAVQQDPAIYHIISWSVLTWLPA